MPTDTAPLVTSTEPSKNSAMVWRTLAAYFTPVSFWEIFSDCTFCWVALSTAASNRRASSSSAPKALTVSVPWMASAATLMAAPVLSRELFVLAWMGALTRFTIHRDRGSTTR